MIRQIRLAIEESEQDSQLHSRMLNPSLPRWPRLGKVKGKRGLWAESARDGEGGLLEQVHDVYILEPDRTQDIPLLMEKTFEKFKSETTFPDIDDILQASPVMLSSDQPTPPHTLHLPQSFEPKINISIYAGRNLENINDREQEPPPSNQHAGSQHSFVDIDDIISPPRLHSPTSISSNTRSPMPSLRDCSHRKRIGCTTNTQSVVSRSEGSLMPVLAALTTNPQKAEWVLAAPLTPPLASGRFINIEEILDSEDEVLEALSPTPPRIHRLQDSGPLPLVYSDGSPSKTSTTSTGNLAITPIFRILTTQLEWANIKTTIFTSITTHVRSIPSATNPKTPSWHEKILMYDPIVLEEFTAYLNTHTTIRAFKKATQKQIKAWNANLKLKGEAIMSVSMSGEEILAIEKELEAYMVQGWCESMSVCCIWGEGKGKSGVRKGFY